MYQALYRKYRPSSFEDVVGQNIIVQTLTNAINNNKVSHAYLFSGPRGTGKTSIAKVFAKILNCEHIKNATPCNKCVSCTQINNNQNIDVIEIDAASNNGVEEIREIRNKISLVPTNSKYKIYIIDEVHMLTNQAFNALLKTLEEPPSHAIFIFATTEIYKIPKTILSRCQRFDYKKVSHENMLKRLTYIKNQENIKITDEALSEIAILSDGGMRDAISLLDQANSYANDEVTIECIHEINGTISKNEITNFLTNFFNKDLINVLTQINSFEDNGKDIVKITQEIIDYLKNLLIYNNTSNYIKENKTYEELLKITNNETLYTLIKNFSHLINEMKKTNNIKTLFEIEIIKNINSNEKEKIQVEEKIIKIEEKVEEEIKEPIKELNNNKLSKEQTEKINKIKNIRINNSLITFSRKNRDEFKEKIENLNTLLLEPKYSKYISLILDGEVKAITGENFVLVYDTELLANEFNILIDDIENILKEVLNDTYKPIAVSKDEWEIIRKDYNENKDKYVYQEEEKEEKIIKEEKNDIELEFDDIIEYS